MTKRLHDINTVMHLDGDTILVGLDEYGKEFTITMDTYELLKWLDFKEMKASVIKYLNKFDEK